jgi:hypothetical protein
MDKTLLYSDLQITIDDFLTEETPIESLMTWIDELNDIIVSGDKIIHPQSIIKLFDIQEFTDKTVTIGNQVLECGKRIVSQLCQSEQLAVFTCSVGSGPSKQYKIHWENNDPLKAYYTDMLGSIAVEKSMDIFQKQLETEMKKTENSITNRYSPGYCGWVLVEQAKLFELLPDKPCGITLTPSSLMMPEKSISGIIGVGRKVEYSEYGCQLCELSHCIYRKKRQAQQKI